MNSEQPAASPSSPSARFTALLAPVTMNQTSRIARTVGRANPS